MQLSPVINPIAYRQPVQTIGGLVSQLGQRTLMPDSQRNYCTFNYPLVNQIVSHRENALPYVTNFLSQVSDERQITEGLYVLDRMIEANVKGVKNTYPTISRFNNTTSPSVQAMLAGIYRKTQVPDAFGPLMKMMIRNSLLPACPYFDPTEEIGGAMLDYIRAKGAVHFYSQGAMPPVKN